MNATLYCGIHGMRISGGFKFTLIAVYIIFSIILAPDISFAGKGKSQKLLDEIKKMESAGEAATATRKIELELPRCCDDETDCKEDRQKKICRGSEEKTRLHMAAADNYEFLGDNYRALDHLCAAWTENDEYYEKGDIERMEWPGFLESRYELLAQVGIFVSRYNPVLAKNLLRDAQKLLDQQDSGFLSFDEKRRLTLLLNIAINVAAINDDNPADTSRSEKTSAAIKLKYYLNDLSKSKFAFDNPEETLELVYLILESAVSEIERADYYVEYASASETMKFRLSSDREELNKILNTISGISNKYSNIAGGKSSSILSKRFLALANRINARRGTFSDNELISLENQALDAHKKYMKWLPSHPFQISPKYNFETAVFEAIMDSAMKNNDLDTALYYADLLNGRSFIRALRDQNAPGSSSGTVSFASCSTYLNATIPNRVDESKNGDKPLDGINTTMNAICWKGKPPNYAAEILDKDTFKEDVVEIVGHKDKAKMGILEMYEWKTRCDGLHTIFAVSACDNINCPKVTVVNESVFKDGRILNVATSTLTCFHNDATKMTEKEHPLLFAQESHSYDDKRLDDDLAKIFSAGEVASMTQPFEPGTTLMITGSSVATLAIPFHALKNNCGKRLVESFPVFYNASIGAYIELSKKMSDKTKDISAANHEVWIGGGQKKYLEDDYTFLENPEDPFWGIYSTDFSISTAVATSAISSWETASHAASISAIYAHKIPEMGSDPEYSTIGLGFKSENEVDLSIRDIYCVKHGNRFVLNSSCANVFPGNVFQVSHIASGATSIISTSSKVVIEEVGIRCEGQEPIGFGFFERRLLHNFSKGLDVAHAMKKASESILYYKCEENVESENGESPEKYELILWIPYKAYGLNLSIQHQSGVQQTH